MGYKLFCDNANFNTIGRQTSNTISGESPYGRPRLMMLRSTSCGLAGTINGRKLTWVHTGAIGFKGSKNFGHIQALSGLKGY